MGMSGWEERHRESGEKSVFVCECDVATLFLFVVYSLLPMSPPACLPACLHPPTLPPTTMQIHALQVDKQVDRQATLRA